MSAIPENLLYTKEHEWLAIDGDVATIGITAHAADALGDIVYVALPGVGDALKSGAVVGEVESTKSVGEVFAPVAGEVVEINQASWMPPIRSILTPMAQAGSSRCALANCQSS